MICQRGLRALLYGNMSHLGKGCGNLLRTSNLVRSTGYLQKCEPQLSELHNHINCCEILLKRGMSCVAAVGVDIQSCQWLPRGVLVVPRRSAGHSKWQNIRHVKQANDMARGVAFSKLSVKLKIAVHEGKSPDPKLNAQLAHVVDEAKRLAMPLSKIENIIKSCEGSKEVALKPFTLEAKGPGGTFFIVELLTDNINRSRNQVKYQLSKLGVIFVDGISHMFKYKGVVAVDPMPSNLAHETAVDVAIDVGAEDVVEATADDGTAVLQFLCEPREFYKVKTALVDRGYTLKFSKFSYLPDQKVSLNDEHLDLMSKIGDVLDNHPDVDTFFDNVE